MRGSNFIRVKLPNADNALIQREKIADYLLNAAHSDNNGKAEFFGSFGFSPGNWEILASAFRRAASDGEVIQHLETSHGVKYVLDAVLETPSGKLPLVRMVWMLTVAGIARDWSPRIQRSKMASMIKEHSRIVLTASLPAHGLVVGDVGTVVHVYEDGRAYEVEFFTLDRHTADVVTVEASQVRPVARREMVHSRPMAA